MLKKVFWVACLLLISHIVNAQFIKGFVAGGLIMAQVDGDEAYGYKKTGANFGVGVMIPFKKNWDISMETSFSQKGARQKAQYSMDSLNGAYKLNLNYLEIPVLIHYTDKEFITVGTGLSWARLIDAAEWEHGRQTRTTAQNKIYKPNDLSVLLDLKMKIYKKLKFNFRYSYSMLKIRTREFSTVGGTTIWTRHQYNNTLTFRLVYIFNEEQSERVVRENKLSN
ncbi:MAG: hypothetical protein FD155_1677 [Bacteroidetes bacterium]|nr:MAG: hypothetical protein FD155_1677 [Bacteroidota bacterium]